MDLNGRNLGCRNRVTKCDACVGVSAGIEDNEIKLFTRFLNPGYQFTFMVGLSEIDLDSCFLGSEPDRIANISKRLGAIDAGFS